MEVRRMGGDIHKDGCHLKIVIYSSMGLTKWRKVDTDET